MVFMMRKRFALIVLLTVAAAAATVSTSGRKFYDDDPIARVPETRSAAGAKPLDIDLFFEYSFNLFVNASRKPSNTRAGNVNTIDEVPDSSWFTNRIGAVPMTAEALARGVNSDTPPAPAKWTLLREKSSGTNPGFTALDANGADVVPAVRRAGAARGQQRRRRGGDQAVLGARLQPGGDVHHVVRSRASRDRSQGDGETAERIAHAVHPGRHQPRAGARGAQRRRHLSRVRGPACSGPNPRIVPLRGHAVGRPQRSRAARASARAARASRVRGVDEFRRLESQEHDRRAASRRTASRRSGTTCRTSARRSGWRTIPASGTWAGSTTTTPPRPRSAS